MSNRACLVIMVLACLLTAAARAPAQSTPYIGFVYPAGGQQGTTVEVRLGGQRIDGLRDALVSGQGVKAEVARYYRKLSPQEISLLREQLQELRREAAAAKKAKKKVDPQREQFIARIDERIKTWVNRPASQALSSIAVLNVTIADDAEPGAREIRLIGSRGLTNPMVFHVGQLPEHVRKPMGVSPFQVLGKEALAQRKRPEEEAEMTIDLPCIVNGQIASGERNSYRFTATKGQQLVFAAKARELVPYIADAVPGWFQPVMQIQDSQGRELAYADDFRFKPDPTLVFQVPKDGEYVLTVTDAIYRGREDFVYRVTIGQLPLITSVFPLGGKLAANWDVNMDGWNLDGVDLLMPGKDANPSTHYLQGRKDGYATNQVPWKIDTLPEIVEQEPNDSPSQAQVIELPVIINGRVDRAGDGDVFQFECSAGDAVVAEIFARRIDSPLDSIIRVTDEAGKILTLNDDSLDASSGLNTHHADSYLSGKAPADGKYFVHLRDTAGQGGEAYGYRLRISPPRPDFALRVVPSSINIRGKSAGPATVYVIRRDGFAGPVRVNVQGLPDGLTAAPVTIAAGSEKARLILKTKLRSLERPVKLTVIGHAKIKNREVRRRAEPAEDRMQAFLWRHLVVAKELQAMVVNPSFQPPPTRPRPPKPTVEIVPDEPPKFTARQVAGRLRQLGLLFDEWLLTDDFYNRKVAECEVAAPDKPLVAKKK